MDKTVLEAAKSGDESLIQELKEHKIDPHQVTTQIMNTILHISVSFNQTGVSKGVLRLCPFLLYQANSNGDTPLHIAAKVGSLEMVELLVMGVSNNDMESQLHADLLRMKNLNQRDTALHVAVKNGNFAVAKLLMEKDAGLLDLVNGANESPLFLAVEGSFLDIAQHILQHFPSAPCCGSNGMNALHAAVIRTHHGQVFEYRAPALSLEKLRRQLSGFLLRAGDQCVHTGDKAYLQLTQIDIMKKLLENRRELAEEKDEFDWTPLHCAAHLGHVGAAQLLLSNSSTCIAYFQDKEGMSALHIAAMEGHVNLMEEILHHCPDAFDMVDERGWTPLHVAVANKKLSVVQYILKSPFLKNLINVADKEGNTPLHLAAGGDKYSIIKILADDIMVFKKAQNLNFQKPIDLIRTNPNMGELRKSLIAKKLEKQGGRPSLRSLVHGKEYGNVIKKKFKNIVGYKRATHDDHDQAEEVGREHQDKDMKSYRLKNISSIHLLVASLIATVTFTAGFTMPGGYEDQDPLKKGMALLSNQTSFQLFVIADSIAFYCSSASVFLQFCGAVEHDYYLLLRFTRVAATLTYISSLGMVVAFTSAMYAVMPHSKLADYTLVSGICCVFVYIFGFL
ncbi:uncharacterized protein LOC125421638 [Ziziphus jujuba]|uniref:Uncharacterized protein LOC125421638 n=1 Tax=Ziziphus jujuba TaxID=326968 RepID=A0ABM4AGN8_ZIZJJ|nr:uncharacterized protein LOC125421638 [Ziziphus jujuba]